MQAERTEEAAESLTRGECALCGGHLKFPSQAAGMTIDCPHCGKKTILTATTKPPAIEPKPQHQAQSSLTMEELLAAFQGRIRPAPVSIVYRAGMVLVAVTMVLLPMAYAVLVGTIGWLTVRFAQHFYPVLTHGTFRGRSMAFAIMLYIGGILIGATLVFFMLKPMLARRGPSAQPLALNPEAEPVLYAFIARICELVGAPLPGRIDLDCELNASASFRRGFRSMLGNDLVLTIGVPLAGNLRTHELAGVVAHEFGHFAQGAGMRLSYVIRSVNAWFWRVVYERDAWDLWLVELANEAQDGRVALLLGCARFAIWGTRQMLKLLMFIGHGVSCLLLRQMEYDADSYEIALAGSAAFESTTIRLHTLGAGLESAYMEMRTSLNLNKRLPDNLPRFLARHERKLPDFKRTKLENTIGLERTRVFDTHPSPADRIRAARKAAASGIFSLDVPATALFSNFDAVARQVTLLHYSEDLGLPLEILKLVPVSETDTVQESAPGAA